MNDCEMGWKGCGRIDPHPGHHWYRKWLDVGIAGPYKVQRDVYWCKGHWIVEGGSPHGNPLVADPR